MYEHQRFESILERMLDRVSNDVDKREGSVIYSALAPAAAELAQMYYELDVNYELIFVSTSSGEELTKRCAELGVNREVATRAIRRGEFYDNENNPMDIPLQSRFSIDDLNFIAIEKIALGVYRMQCEQTGAIGNTEFGRLIPIQNIEGLARAELTDILIAGDDEESDEELRERFYEVVNEPPFGGNIADYKQKINAIDGVGATKVFPVWQGGGTVKCTIISSDWNPPSQTLLDDVQTIIDPLQNQGVGLGLAPIDHTVTIAGVQSVTIDVETTITLASGTTIGQVQQAIRNAIEGYLVGLRQSWATEEQLVVRVALLDSQLLTVDGILDISNTKINGATDNIVLDAEEIPVLGEVTLHE